MHQDSVTPQKKSSAPPPSTNISPVFTDSEGDEEYDDRNVQTAVYNALIKIHPFKANPASAAS